MPWRIRRSVRIAKGVRVNFGKKGMSVTSGVKGFHTTVGHGQVRTTVGLPGTGISYTHVSGKKKQARRTQKLPQRSQSQQLLETATHTCRYCGFAFNAHPSWVGPCPRCMQSYQPPQPVYASQSMYMLTQQKNWMVALLLCIFLGWFGAHRFYTGQTGIGLIQLFTFGGFFMWTIIDLLLILTGAYRDKNGLPLRKS